MVVSARKLGTDDSTLLVNRGDVSPRVAERVVTGQDEVDSVLGVFALNVDSSSRSQWF
jgi:hypothetical protein